MNKKRTTPKRKPHRVADSIRAGMREIEAMIASGKRPEELFTVRTVEIPDPGDFVASDVRKLRASMGVSQAVFAQMIGVSRILVQKWEGGEKIPSPLARRLLDTIKADPSRWISTIRRIAS
jgi:DNA-binding transcriptional regulator YiaG